MTIDKYVRRKGAFPMIERPMIILNNPTNVNQTEKRIEKELVLQEDYSEELENNFKKRMNAENLDFILPDKLEVKETKKHK